MAGLTEDRLRRGRDRMSLVLAGHLEPGCALERANNIAQALCFGGEDPEQVALAMLPDLGSQDRSRVARAVSAAWSTRRRRHAR